MKPLSKDTIERMISELPAYDWNEEDLSELFAPHYGVISGFGQILEDIRRLQQVDLEDIGPAGGL